MFIIQKCTGVSSALRRILNKFHYTTSSFLGAGDIRFSLNGTIYQNNSIVTLEDIGEDDDALFCMTNLSACCRSHGSASGNWYFPNTTRVPSDMDHINRSLTWDIYRTREHMVVYMHRRRGGEKGIYYCEIHDSMNVMQTIYIGVYTAGTGQ